MRKLAITLVLLLGAALLHAGTMAGFSAFTSLSSGHTASAHHEHAPLDIPFCPIGSMCPAVANPLLNLAVAASALVILFVVVFVVTIRLSSNALLPLSYAGPPGFRPNSAHALLSVFKRE